MLVQESFCGGGVGVSRVDQTVFFISGGIYVFQQDAETVPLGERGGNIPCAMNAANEVANLLFRQGKIKFSHIAEIISREMQDTCFIPTPSIDDIMQTDREVRERASSLAI